MFYDLQPLEQQEKYKEMLAVMGKLSNMFSDNECPYLAYRAHENIFCKYFDAENLARHDCSADAKKDRIGIGLKTWIGNDDQKVAEFGRLKSSYSGLSGYDLVRRIAEYRNERIRVTKRLYGIDEMIYHIVKRVPGAMEIFECAFDPIELDSIEIDNEKGNENNTYFKDGKHEYHFSSSKNTLFMIFDDMELMDSFDVSIADDPYSLIKEIMNIKEDVELRMDYDLLPEGTELVLEMGKKKDQLCLPLYSIKNGIKFVAEKSGLNQWNAGGRVRDANEIYIPYQAVDRNRKSDFFPPRDTPFILRLPDGSKISAKVCQEADRNNPLLGKAIMSNPNKILGKWLLRDVFELPERTLITYDMLEKFGIDSVIFTKNAEKDYSIIFSEIGAYEEFYAKEGE